MFGRKPKLPIDAVFETTDQPSSKTTKEYKKYAAATTPSATNTATTTAAPDVKPSKDLGAIPKTGSHHYPKYPTFYGEDNKANI
ncbi:hypothetical protein DPMN_083710 [Dreissena polymorpha]|uniref:Uncharacterized protein n=1 Tax=Dreissena polymorpha TaxID=45954 RepID=A0A9D3Y9T5_DREPO|nr:hypothetical protein DPMN_083710 [Dreissena polymorpha]